MSLPGEWDVEAASFDTQPDHGLHDEAVRGAWRELMMTALPPVPARVADLGCGTGTLSVLLAAEGYRVDGVDFSSEMVRLAREKAGGRFGVRILLGDASDPPLPHSAYDVVLCRHVLWALPDPPTALERWVDLLVPEGRLVLIEGEWHTGAGLSAARVVELLEGVGRRPEVTWLSDEKYWGGAICDERYLVVA